MNLKNKTPKEIKEIFTTGRIFYKFREKYHVIGYIFDGDEEFIIVKSWNKWKNCWCREVWDFDFMSGYEVRSGYINLTKPKMPK